MRTVNRCAVLAVIGLAVTLQGTARPQEKGGDGVTLRTVNYDGLAEEILKNRGKVVIVDFWTENCLPCRKALPHLVDLYNTHKKDGLTAITVALDPAWRAAEDGPDPDLQKRLLKFLQSKKAIFTNLILDDSKAVVKDKLRIEAVPNVYVFSRTGKWTQFGGGDKYDEIDAMVKKLLKE